MSNRGIKIKAVPEGVKGRCAGCYFSGQGRESAPIFGGKSVTCSMMECGVNREIYVPDDEPATTQTDAPAVGMKFDGGKRRWTLLTKGCSRALGAVVDVLGFGATKYAADSWQTVPQARERYHDALLRHLDSIARNGFTARDPETGFLEWAHVACNALFLCTFAVLDSEDDE